jgi:hypothetical protein
MDNPCISEGSRLITKVYFAETTVFMLTIYDKSEKDDISDKELYELLEVEGLPGSLSFIHWHKI